MFPYSINEQHMVSPPPCLRLLLLWKTCVGIAVYSFILRTLQALTVRSGASATIGIVSKLVDMHASLGGGIVALDIIADCCWRSIRGLFEGNSTADLQRLVAQPEMMRLPWPG